VTQRLVDSMQAILPEATPRPVEEMGIKELERIRLILRGGSVIDWRRLQLRTRAEADRFLRTCLLDPSDPMDEAWMRVVLADAVSYLRQTYNYKVATQVANPKEIHDLFLYASAAKGTRKLQKIACIVLKVMHVVQHIEGRDLLFRLEASEAEIAELVAFRVATVIQEMKQHGLPIVDFEHSFKSRESLVTKLLAKKDTVAAQVYDKTRFRIVTRARADIVPVLYYLTQRMFPFNFVLPGQTENSLVPFRELLARYPNFAQVADELQLAADYERIHDSPGANQFSGKGYRVLNFVVDIPVRLDAYLPPPEKDTRERKNRIGFALSEFQIVDVKTAAINETGDNSHEQYKARQKKQVLARLSRGLVVPKETPKPRPRRRSAGVKG
jgi:uncharacterized protein (TIGR04552 family)